MTEIKAKKVLFKNRDGESLIPYIGEDYVKNEDMVEINFVPKDSMQEIPCITETYVNGTSWYRVWSDGWCEQGGFNAPTSNVYEFTVNLLKPYLSNGYTILVTGRGLDSHDYHYDASSVLYNSVTTSSFNIARHTQSTTGAYWQTCGYIK